MPTVSASSSGATTPIPVDMRRFKFGVGLLVTFASNTTGTVNVEVSGDGRKTVATNWNLHDVLQGITKSTNSSLAYPCSLVRLNVVSLTSSNSSSPSVTLAVVQAKGN